MTASADRRRGAILQGTDPGSPPHDSGPSASDVTPAWVVGFVGFAISLGLALRFLVPAGMDATIFLALGEKSTAQTTYARTRLGDVATRYELGHDGQWFFILANDPLHLYPKENAAVLDRPLYRAQRMMYPLIASGFGSLPPEAIVWAMLVINLVAFGLGTMFAARIATVSGASPWIGLAVPLNIGLLFELWIDGSGLLAFVFCLGGVLALAERREWLAAMLFAAAALSRETMLLFAVGVLIAAWLDTRRTDWKLVAVPSLAVALWFGYLLLRLGGIRGQGVSTQLLGPPFLGLYRAFQDWIASPGYLALNIALVVIVVAFAFAGVRSRAMIVWGALPFVALAMILSEAVWRQPFDISRAVAPVFTAAPFLLLMPSGVGRRPAVSDG